MHLKSWFFIGIMLEAGSLRLLVGDFVDESLIFSLLKFDGTFIHDVDPFAR